MVMECSVSQLYQYQHPGFDTILQFCKMLPLRKQGIRYMISLCIVSYKCIQIYNYLKINSLIKNSNFWQHGLYLGKKIGNSLDVHK